MPNEEITNIVAEFCNTFDGILNNYPQYRLDGGFQSLSTINLLLEPFYGKSEFSKDELKYLNGCAGYISAIVHDIWAYFPGTDSLELSLDSNNEIILTISGAKYTSSKSPYIINITRTLRKFLSSDKVLFSGEYSEKADINKNLLSTAVLGIASGLSPYGIGEWVHTKAEDLLEHIALAVTSFATSSARTYKERFPLEPHGSNVELYISGLIYPPTGLENYPYAKSCISLIKFKNRNALDDDEFFTLSKNLASLPDPRISETGLICAVCLAKSDDFNLRLIADSKMAASVDISTAIQKIRPQIASGNFLQVLEERKIARAVEILETERIFNLVPYLKLPTTYCKYEHLTPLITALYSRDLNTAEDCIKELESNGKVDAEVFLQKIFIQICLGKFDDAKGNLKKIDHKALPSESTAQAHFLEMLGIIAHLEQNWENAYNYLTKAIHIKDFSNYEKIVIAENVSNTLMGTQQFEKALQFLNYLEQHKLQNLNILINHCLAYMHLDKKNDFRDILKVLLATVPFDKRVFALLRMSLSMGG